MVEFVTIFYTAMVVNFAVILCSSGAKISKYIGISPFCGMVTSSDSIDKIESKWHTDEEKFMHKSYNDDLGKQKRLLYKYLGVYLLARMSDWLQGPFVYALLSSYEFSQDEIAMLFVSGYISSMIFGSFIGGMADTRGRKRYVILFTILYTCSCITKHFKHFWLLFGGRILAGISTSLMYSVFDSWLIKAHEIENIDKALIHRTFSITSYGNSVIAIVSGLISNYVAHKNKMTEFKIKNYFVYHVGGFINPHDVAIVALIICGILAQVTWEENYGTKNEKKNSHVQFGDQTIGSIRIVRNALLTAIRTREILLCGIISSLFEGSMYIFVFMWTPMLSNGKSEIPLGLIFATFMICCMIGSSLFSIMMNFTCCLKIGVIVFLTASLSMAIIFKSNDIITCFIGMNIFEICVGMYFPFMGTMKSKVVPENHRAAIYNIYRIPLNMIVVFSLLSGMTPINSFKINALMMVVAFVLQVQLMYIMKSKATNIISIPKKEVLSKDCADNVSNI